MEKDLTSAAEIEKENLLSGGSSSSSQFEIENDEERQARRRSNSGSNRNIFHRGFSSSIPSLRGGRISLRYIAIVAAFFFIFLIYVTGTRYTNRPAARRFTKPKGTKVIGVVFYGRRDRTAILDCFLKRNLVVNGGWLDEVVWGINTEKVDDLEYLEHQLLPSTPYYRKVEIEEHSYWGLWNKTIDAGNIYVKLDDDVVYMDDDAIPYVVNTLVTDPSAVIVSANMINSPELNWLQYRTGAILPYLPELSRPRENELATLEHPVWRSSQLPDWMEPGNFAPPEVRDDWNDYIKSLIPKRKPKPFKVHHDDEQEESDAENLSEEHEAVDEIEDDDYPALHRWLPVRGAGALSKTPIAQTEWSAFGMGLWSWLNAAQQHYSFLDNLEHNRKYLYYLTHGRPDLNDGVWDHSGERISINFLALRGEDVLSHLKEMKEHGDDEAYLSEKLPKAMGKRLLVNTRALAAHYSFGAQSGMESTDILARYRAYAVEKMCPGSFLDSAW